MNSSHPIPATLNESWGFWKTMGEQADAVLLLLAVADVLRGAGFDGEWHAPIIRLDSSDLADKPCPPSCPERERWRSEEHTSELQSQR